MAGETNNAPLDLSQFGGTLVSSAPTKAPPETATEVAPITPIPTAVPTPTPALTAAPAPLDLSEFGGTVVPATVPSVAETAAARENAWERFIKPSEDITPEESSANWKEFRARLAEPVKMEEIEKIPGLQPKVVAGLAATGEDTLGSVFGKEKADYIREHILHGFTPEVTARAAAKTLTDWYSPAMLALSVPGRIAHGYVAAAEAASKIGDTTKAAEFAGKARLAGAIGTVSGIPLVGKQVQSLIDNWGGMSPTERNAALLGIIGGSLMTSVAAKSIGITPAEAKQHIPNIDIHSKIEDFVHPVSPDEAAQRAMRPSKRQAQKAQADLAGARPYLGGAKDLKDLQGKAAAGMKEVWTPYKGAVDGPAGDVLAEGPDGPETIRELERKRIKTSADLDTWRSSRPIERAAILQKSENIQKLTERYESLTDAIDPVLRKTGIDPVAIRTTYGQIKGVAKTLAGRNTLSEAAKTYGLGRIFDLDLTHPLRNIPALRDIVSDLFAGRGGSLKPTDVAVREGFRPGIAGPKPVLTPGPPPETDVYSGEAPTGPAPVGRVVAPPPVGEEVAPLAPPMAFGEAERPKKGAAEIEPTPMKVYHATGAGVENIEHLDAEYSHPTATAGPGIYLTREPETASAYVSRTPGARVLGGQILGQNLLDASRPLSLKITQENGLPDGATYLDALKSIRERSDNLETAVPEIKEFQKSLADMGFHGVENIYPHRDVFTIFGDDVLPEGQQYPDLVRSDVPTKEDIMQVEQPAAKLLDLPENVAKELGITTQSVINHELGHAVVADAVGLKAVEMRSHLHPEVIRQKATATMHLDLSSIGADKQGRIRFSDIKSIFIDKFVPMYYAGGVAQELVEGIPFSENKGMSGDLEAIDDQMHKLGFSKEEIALAHKVGEAEARKILTKAGTSDIIKRYSNIREENLPDTLHMSEGRIQEFLREIRGEKSEQNKGANSEGEETNGKFGGSRGVDHRVVQGAPAAGAGEGAKGDQGGVAPEAPKFAERPEVKRTNIPLAAGLLALAGASVIATHPAKEKPVPLPPQVIGGAPVLAAKPDIPTLIDKSAKDEGVPPSLLQAQARQESKLDPDAVSPKGAQGVMQLMPKTADALGVDPTDPEQNIAGGAAYMHQLHRHFGHWDRALAAYNWGPDRVQEAIDRYGENWLYHTPDETQNYVRKILYPKKKTVAK